MSFQRAESAGQVNYLDQEYAVKLLQNVQRLLKPVGVINPFAEYLILPSSVFKPRRTNAHYLHFIEAVTFYCQHQREKKYDKQTGEQYIETTIEDIKMANDLIKSVLLRKSDQLNGATRNYLENLKAYLKTKGNTIFFNKEIRRELRIAESTLRRYHALLEEEGYIIKHKEDRHSSYSYEIVDVDEFFELEQTIDKALNLCLEKLQIDSATS